MPVDSVTAGLWGKLPARGDFVRVGLGRAFTDAWDGWMSAMLVASRAALGDDWQDAWMVAPVWRFCLAAGVCGAQPVLGLWMPSVDSAGRAYPLTLAALLPADVRPAAVHPGAAEAAWLDAAEHAGRAALDDGWDPQRVAGQLPPLPAVAATATNGGGSLWWGEDVAPIALAGLPDGAMFTSMLACDAARIP